jgi:DNA-binding MarR family transcriptional regulator
MMPAMASRVSKPQVTDTWRELQERHARVSCALDKRLQDEHRLSTSEFEVLEQLAGVGCQDHERMQDLADAVRLSQSALSRLVGRLEEQGLITRQMCQDDRRGIYAWLTDDGRARYEAALPTHRAVLDEHLAA